MLTSQGYLIWYNNQHGGDEAQRLGQALHASEGDGRMIDGDMAPGDQAPPGTAGTGENVCPNCNGSGKAEDGICPVCEGRGTVIEGIGGG
jgi:DnaJ-class molecular chaperone